MVIFTKHTSQYGRIYQTVRWLEPCTAAAAAAVVVKDDYDKYTRELAMEVRGQASDRVRTQEEVEAGP